jgi:hypothetical protein
MQLSENIQAQLRAKGVLGPNEVAEQQGNVIVALDLVTQARRVINEGALQGVSIPRVLRD